MDWFAEKIYFLCCVIENDFSCLPNHHQVPTTRLAPVTYMMKTT